MANTNRQMRQHRLNAAANAPWLANRMKSAMLPEYEAEGLPNPVVAARYLGDLAEEEPLADPLAGAGFPLAVDLSADGEQEDEGRRPAEKLLHRAGIVGENRCRNPCAGL